jgi:uronate dehydrogenase
VTCLRIGNVGPRPLDVRRLSIWISPQDIVQLIRIGLEHPDIRFEIVYGASDNAASWWDNSRARQLGYRPTGKAEDHRAHAEAEQAKIGSDAVGDLFQGGAFCSAEFTNDVKRAGP